MSEVREIIEVRGHQIEMFTRDAKKWLWRILYHPCERAREWHGWFNTREDAMADIEARTAPIRLTKADVAAKKHHGYYSVVNGVPTVMAMCPLTGATVLTSFELIVGEER